VITAKIGEKIFGARIGIFRGLPWERRKVLIGFEVSRNTLNGYQPSLKNALEIAAKLRENVQPPGLLTDRGLRFDRRKRFVPGFIIRWQEADFRSDLVSLL
jgi:hypothetical protein